MKKLLLAVATVFALSATNAQEDMNMSSSPTDQGNWLVEMNTGFGSAGSAIGSQTGLGFSSWTSKANPGTDEEYEIKNTDFTFGLEGGYFVAKDFAIKGGLGYLSRSTKADGEDKFAGNGFSWMLGSKYYIVSQWPVQLDLRGTALSGALYKDVNGDDPENPLWLGLQGGYAWFITDHISLEPALKYNFSLNDDYAKGGAFEFRVGFAAFF